MKPKKNFKVILGIALLIVGLAFNLLVVFPEGFMRNYILCVQIGFRFNIAVTVELFYALLILINLVVGLIPYVPGYIVLYLNRDKKLLKKTKLILLATHIISVIVYISYVCNIR